MGSRKRLRGAPRKGSGASISAPVHWVGLGEPEDDAALSFSAADVTALIDAAGIAPTPNLAMTKVAEGLKQAVSSFLWNWRTDARSSPGGTAAWSHKTAKQARDLLKTMLADPQTGISLDNDACLTLLRHPPLFERGGRPYESPAAQKLRREMRLFPTAYRRNREVQDLYARLEDFPDALVPDPVQAIRQTLKGLAYIAGCADATAEYQTRHKTRARNPDTVLLTFVADINRLFELVFGRKGALTTDSYHEGPAAGAAPRGPVIPFTQAVAHWTARRLPKKPQVRADVGMREALMELADSASVTAGRIRTIRSAKWKAGATGTVPLTEGGASVVS